MQLLSDVKLRHLKPKEKPYTIADGDGLLLEIMPNGHMFWRFRIQKDGKMHKYTLGQYPLVNLSMARDLRDKKKSMVKYGLETQDTPTFKEIAERWLTEKEQISKASERTRYIPRGKLENHVFPVFGSKPFNEVTPDDVKTALNELMNYGHNAQAQKVFELIREIYRTVTKYGDCNPTKRLNNYVGYMPARHFPSLQDPKDIGLLMRLMEEYHGTFVVKCAMKMSALTFLRSAELRGARWDELDLDDAVWRLPKERMKMKKYPQIVPLSRQAVEIFKQLQPVTGQYEHVFVAAGNRPICENAVLNAVRSFSYEEGKNEDAQKVYYFGKDDISAHGFRATASTRLHEEGWPDAAIEIQLAHVIGDSVKRAYDYAKYLATRRTMMQWWADYLDSLRDGKPKPPKGDQSLRG